ncbi:MAG: beta-ketoacyl-ACP synthase III [Eubacteriales bacterium]|jgi:3-oxoacyl-[acyl-carrier-protein] synthase-3|nr:ketoacyl-ACP synthase III [Clostridiales bacterium]
MSFYIAGTGSYVPERALTNDELSKMVDTSDEWITQRVGVKERRVCTKETVGDIACRAAQRALQNAGVDPDELDLIIAATISADMASPSLGCIIERDIGASCMAFDVSAACSGFIFALDVAAGYFARGKVKTALVVGAERMSRLVDWNDRSTCVIFGDGAGAAVLRVGEGYIDSTFTVRGGDDVIRIPNYVGTSPFFKVEMPPPYIYMNGQETFKFAVNAMVSDVLQIMEKNNLTASDVSYIIPHQANSRIVELAQRRLGLRAEMFYVNIERYGNTSAASIPIALDELNRGGSLSRGDKIILTAFGSGLANAACLIVW